jgi:hypothetical protein
MISLNAIALLIDYCVNYLFVQIIEIMYFLVKSKYSLIYNFFTNSYIFLKYVKSYAFMMVFIYGMIKIRFFTPYKNIVGELCNFTIVI